ncbi:hypothetical protein K435DRAFT_797007 [Dendrothele bispora CBS 962.96]|uniref:Uncharacterized protein n=1 Tax=Dendrothele bispora (strain CBS 962.96) TaxID=1314807 RepID=A0A4S8M533_DENBC|nr:hypothetical protein K435DRAFT_797007 [Dendrothele bispora CBS 962.96]
MSQVNLTATDFDNIRHTFTETACGVGVYGAYAILFITTAYMLIREDLSKSRIRQILLAITLIMFSGASVIEMVYVRLFLMSVDELETGTETYTEWDRLYKALVVFSRINYLLSDGIVVWRAYILYPRNLPVKALLVTCMIGSIAAAWVDGVLSLKSEARTHSEREGMISFVLFIPLLVTNALSTCLVAFKAWEYRKHVSSLMSDDKRSGNKPVVERVLILLIESGLIYIAYWVISMLSALGLMGPLGDGILECILPQIAGIYLTVIILLVAFQRSTGSTAVTPANATDHSSAMIFAAAHDVPLGSQSLSGFTLHSPIRSQAPQIGASFIARLRDDSDWTSGNPSEVEKGPASYPHSRSTSTIAAQ